MNNAFEKAEAARYYIQNQIPHVQLDFAILTGTGMQIALENWQVIKSISYSEIPHFVKNTVKSHAGELLIVRYEGKNIAVFSGRFHAYEGYSGSDIVFPIRVMKLLNIETLLMTNAAGAVNPDFEKGDIVAVRDHINAMGMNPLQGPHDSRWGARFPDSTSVYDEGLLYEFDKIAKQLNIRFKNGIYLALAGPNLETPSEYNAIHKVADLVGMSTVPEAIVANQMGMRMVVLSIVSNVCYPAQRIEVTSLEDVIEVVSSSNTMLNRLIEHWIRNQK